MAGPPQVAIRADASACIGHGHVMRGLALAAALRARGAVVHVLQRRDVGDARAAVERAGCIAHAWPADAAGDAFDFAAADAAATHEVLRRIGRPDWLVLDHYRLGADWVHALRRDVGRVLVVDDLADRAHDGDLLLDSNWHDDPAARYRGHWPTGRPALFGPAYALLRPEFAASRAALGPRDGGVRRVVVAFGGSDPAGATGACVEALHAARPDLRLDVIVGAGASQAAALQQRWAGHPQVQVTVGASDVATRFAAADLFVGAGGSMTWERACLGLPGVTLPIAENQQPLCRRLDEAGLGIDLGPWHVGAPAALPDALARLTADPARCRAMSRGLAELCDGQGAGRVAANLLT